MATKDTPTPNEANEAPAFAAERPILTVQQHILLESPGQGGEFITSQYYEAYPGHTARLDQALAAEVHQRWLKLARTLGLPAEELENAATRGEFIRRAHALHRQDGPGQEPCR